MDRRTLSPPRPFAISSVLPERVTSGRPASVCEMTISLKDAPRVHPVPRAFITASFAAKSPARRKTVRFLPNPYFVEELRPLDGKSPEVTAFLERQGEKAAFMKHLGTMLDFLVPLYAAEGKSYLTVTLGCTGGKHRSVALAEELGRYLGGQGRTVTVSHRDLGRE